MTLPQRINVQHLSNAEFFSKYAAPGRIGLVGGASLIDRAISAAQRTLDEERNWSSWSHAFLFQGVRMDGHHWIIESDLDVHRKHIRLGVQENRVLKYADDAAYPRVAVVDFGLSPEMVGGVMGVALDMVSDRVKYSVRELFGTMLAMRRPSLQPRENVLARERSVYCSAFVRHVFREAGLDLLPEVSVKNTAPEHLTRSTLPHTLWVMEREKARSRFRKRTEG